MVIRVRGIRGEEVAGGVILLVDAECAGIGHLGVLLKHNPMQYVSTLSITPNKQEFILKLNTTYLDP